MGGMILNEKAEYFAKSLGHNTFSASNGWLDKFKKPNNVFVFCKIFGESACVNKDTCDEWKRKLSSAENL